MVKVKCGAPALRVKNDGNAMDVDSEFLIYWLEYDPLQLSAAKIAFDFE